MMKVRIIRAIASQMEEKINTFFQTINEPGYTIKIESIQIMHLGTKDLEEALILYNKIAPKTNQQPSKPAPQYPTNQPTQLPKMDLTPPGRSR